MDVAPDVRPEKPWLLRYPWQVPHQCEYPGGNAARLLIAWAEQHPAASVPAIGASWTCASLLRSSRRFGNALHGLGFAKGDRVAVWLPACAQSLVAFLGALMAGAVVVPIDTEEEEEAKRRLVDTGAVALVVSDDRLPGIASLRDGTALRTVIATSAADGRSALLGRLRSLRHIRPGRQGIFLPRQDGIERWSRLLGSFADTAVCVEADAANDAAMIRYTRGTTGVPKAARLTHANLIAGAVQYEAWRYEDEEALLRYFADLAFGRRDYAARERAEYGLAEAASAVLAQPPNRFRMPGTTGLPLPDTEVRIVGESNLEPLAHGEVGELALKGPQIAASYWNGKEAAEGTRIDGWLRTGDMAFMDEDGFITVVERKINRIRKEEGPIYPRAVERELRKHPGIADAAVVGMSDESGEEIVQAYVTLRQGYRVSVSQLQRWGLERLGSHEAPVRYEICDQLPSQRRLREELMSGNNLNNA